MNANNNNNDNGSRFALAKSFDPVSVLNHDGRQRLGFVTHGRRE
jgi:hypothetical protein